MNNWAVDPPRVHLIVTARIASVCLLHSEEVCVFECSLTAEPEWWIHPFVQSRGSGRPWLWSSWSFTAFKNCSLPDYRHQGYRAKRQRCCGLIGYFSYPYGLVFFSPCTFNRLWSSKIYILLLCCVIYFKVYSMLGFLHYALSVINVSGQEGSGCEWLDIFVLSFSIKRNKNYSSLIKYIHVVCILHLIICFMVQLGSVL